MPLVVYSRKKVETTCGIVLFCWSLSAKRLKSFRVVSSSKLLEASNRSLPSINGRVGSKTKVKLLKSRHEKQSSGTGSGASQVIFR